jgi:TolB protein
VEGRLLYARDGHIWLRTGTTAHRLTEGTEGLRATQPCWSPNGRQIAYVVRGEGYSDIWVMNSDGSNSRQVTDNRSEYNEGTYLAAHNSFWAFQPHWIGPAGEWIGYISHIRPQSSASLMSIWRIHSDGTEENRYWSLDGQIESPSWSPDGEIVVFTYFPYNNGSQLRYYDPESGVHRPLGDDLDEIDRFDPVWSPDGNWIVYAGRQGKQSDLWVMPSPLNPLIDGEWAPVRLTDQGSARGPTWSPTGQQIAFVAEKGDSFDLWVLNVEIIPGQLPQPGELEQLTFDDHVDATARPSWAP